MGVSFFTCSINIGKLINSYVMKEAFYYMKNKYIYGLDLSLSNSGIAIFNFDGLPEFVGSVATKSSDKYPTRLKIIADEIIRLTEKYPPKIAAFESGFYRFPASTQALYRVQGVLMYLLHDVEQFFYPPSKVKKIVTGKGNASKKSVQEFVKHRFPELEFDNTDQSDAVGVIIAYLESDFNGLR